MTLSVRYSIDYPACSVLLTFTFFVARIARSMNKRCRDFDVQAAVRAAVRGDHSLGAQNMLVGICAAGAVASARTLFAAYLVFGLMATIVPGSARPTSTGGNGEPAVRFAQRAEPRISVA